MVSGSYLAFQLRGSLAFFRIYRDSILNDALAGFTNLEQRANAVADLAFKRFGSRPATDDSGDMEQEAEWANEEGQVYYDAMVGLRQATMNLLSAGLFHLLEQQLAILCYDCEFCDCVLANADIKSITAWYLRYFDINLEKLPQWKTIDELHWLANAVKHGEGSSAVKIRVLRPEVFSNPRLEHYGLKWSIPLHSPVRQPLAGDDLFVTDRLFTEYATATHDFVATIIQHFAQNGKKGYPHISPPAT